MKVLDTCDVDVISEFNYNYINGVPNWFVEIVSNQQHKTRLQYCGF